MKFYGDTTDANSGSSEPLTVHIGSNYAGGADNVYHPGGSGGDQPSGYGKGSINLGDPIGSIGQTIGHFNDFLGGLGHLGIPGGPHVSDVAGGIGGAVGAVGGAVGAGLGAVGGISLPYIGNDPNHTNAHLGDVPGMIGGALSAPEQFIETQAAKARIDASQNRLSGQQLAAIAYHTGRTPEQVAASMALPPDIQARLDAGESVDKLAADMAAQGHGFSSDTGSNLVASMIFDPMNLISLGAGKALTAAKGASEALAAGREIGVGDRFMGKAYDAASRGLSAGGQALMDKTIGPVTSGVFHTLGTRSYNGLKNAAYGLSPAYAQAFEDAFARGAAQIPRAVIARRWMEDTAADIKRYGQSIVKKLPSDTMPTIEARLGAMRKINPGQLERQAQDELARFAPDFAGHTDAQRATETAQKYAFITGMSEQDAARIVGKADLKTAQTVHLAFYGKAGDDLARAKAISIGAKNIDAERLTLIGDNTLTRQRAEDILAGKMSLEDAVNRYADLQAKFGATQFDHAKVTEFIQKQIERDLLPTSIEDVVTNRNKLPKPLGDWRAAYEPYGYEMGFAPKDGWKVHFDANGEITSAAPWAHFVSEADPVTQRNPLGKFADAMFRGTTQTQIIMDSRARMVAVGRQGGLSAVESRAIHHRIIEQAAAAGFSPRGLAMTLKHGSFREIFRDELGDTRFQEFVQKVDPDFAVMKAFQGNIARVGITQAFTGAAKTAFAGRGNALAIISEGIYPILRFSASPLFQAQEFVESPFFNLMRGIQKRVVDPEVAKVYTELSDLPEFKYLTEAGYVLNIMGTKAVEQKMTAASSLLGKATQRFPNVKAFKETQRVAQVMYEHGPEFKDAVNSINPKLWATMEDAYGTTDPREIADAFLRERSALASGELDRAMGTFDNAKADFIQSCYDNGLISKGQEANVAAGVARGGNAAGGAMKLTPEEMARLGAKPLAQSHDLETVWQAFRESFRASSEQAFKTHYFNPTRGFFERSINHPYLGLYPASYMWGKVLPEFARFLLKRPFGLNAPLLGLEAYNRVQQTVIASLAQDKQLGDWVQKSGKDGAIYLVEQLLPGTPQNLPVNAPAWTRHLSQDLAAGKDLATGKPLNPGGFAQTEAGDTFANSVFGAGRSFGAFYNAGADLAGITGDIFKNLNHAAAQLDGAAQIAPQAPPHSPISGLGR